MVPPVADTRRPIWPNSNGQTAYFPMSAIFIFAAAYDLSAALTELRVAIRLCDGRGRNEDCCSRPLRKPTSSRLLRCTLYLRDGSWRDELAVSKTGLQHLSERN